MNNSLKKTPLLEKLLHRTGEWYLIVVIILTEMLASTGVMVGGFLIATNADLDVEQLIKLIRWIAISRVVSSTVLVIATYFIYKNIRLALRSWKETKKKPSGTEANINIWEQLTVLPERYSLLVVFVLLSFIFPTVISQTTALNITTDQLIYSLLGVSAAILSSAIFSWFLLGYFLKPVYKVLYPQTTKEKLILPIGFSIATKMQSITLSLMVLAILIIAPIGYHQTAQALKTGDPKVLVEMQVQSLLFSLAIIAFGLLLSYLFARSVTSPLEHLIDTFKKIEAGDLAQRADITSSDESGGLTVYFNSMVSRLDELQRSLETQIAQRTGQIQASAEVGRIVSSILDPDELIEKVVNLITERLDYYYASIFLISSDGYWAEIKSATGEAGKALQEKKHRLSISGKSMVGSAINLRKARIAHDAGAEAVRFDNPLLPNTRSEIALPLIAGGRVLGALDAQSTEANAFGEEVVETLQGMADQVAVALENARLFQESEQALREIRASHQAQLGKAWAETLAEGELEFSTGQKSLSNKDSLNIPLALRDQVIGEIILEGSPDWVTEDQDWIEAVATQAALALENARLLEDSQQLALQERLVAEITSKIWSSTTPDGILKIAIRELGNALGASEAVIELEVEEE